MDEGYGGACQSISTTAERVKYSAFGVPYLIPPGDADYDGELTIFDNMEFGNRFAAEDHRADLNLDGVFDIYDFLDFGNALYSGEVVTRGALSRLDIENRIGYAGAVWDSHLGLWVMRHRLYDPARGRFLQRDPIGYAGGWNLYEYCHSQPVDWYDPFGLDRWGFWDGWGLTIVNLPRAIFDTTIERAVETKAGLEGAAKEVLVVGGYYVGAVSSEELVEESILASIVYGQTVAGNNGTPTYLLVTGIASAAWEGIVLRVEGIAEGDLEIIGDGFWDLGLLLSPLSPLRGGGLSPTRRAIAKEAEKIAAEGNLVTYVITEKIAKQMSKRGWSQEDIQGALNNPIAKRPATNKRTKTPATAYFREDGSYIVRDDITGDIIQISDCYDPYWKPDETIQNPFMPESPRQ